jgi:hypothetical protein
MDYVTQNIVLKYLQEFRTDSTSTIARTILKENPGLFTDFESARTYIRYYRGQSGSVNRSKIDVEHYIPRVNIPEPVEQNYEPYILNKEDYPLLIGADAHVPYHSRDAIELFLEYGLTMKPKPNTIILLGDWADFYKLSSWNIDPTMPDIKQELEMLKTILTNIRKLFPKTKIIYKYGNHEERYDRYLMTRAPEIFHLPNTHLKEQLELDKLGIEVVTDKRLIKAWHLTLLHGHEYKFSINNPVSPSRGLFVKAKKSAICGHFHQKTEYSEPTITGHVIRDWSIGCLCDLHPLYMPLNKWTNGFATVSITDDFYTVSNKEIISNRIV